MATVRTLEAERARLLAEREILAARYQAGDVTVLPQIQEINVQLRDVVLQIELLLGLPPVSSSGQIVANSQVARDDGANTQLPEVSPIEPATRIPTNAVAFSENVDFGTNNDTRAIVQTQAVPPASADWPIPDPAELPGPGSLPPALPDGTQPPDNVPAGESPTASYTPGVGAVSDDGTTEGILEAGAVTPETPNGSNNVTTLVNKTARSITPQNNILDKFASYTYSASLYLMSPEDYRRLMTTKKRYIPGYQLLMQSGGAPQQSGVQVQDFNDGGSAGVSLTQGRNQYFPLDYYFDDIELKSVIHGKGTGGAHNVVEMKFKIVEPNGITLLDNLYKAVNQYVTVGGGGTTTIKNQNYAAQNYLMVIRFYGYDENGNMITAPISTDPAGKSDNYAIVEKFIPFQFTSIKFRVANKLTEYQCEAVCPQNVIGTGQGRGVIPFNIELTATTLQNLFNGNTTWAESLNNQTPTTEQPSTVAPGTATEAPNPTLTIGLATALNKFQQELVTDGTYEVADKYNIIISHPEIASAAVVPPATTDLNGKPMTNVTTANEAVGAGQSINTRAKTNSAIAGMSIVQFIDLAVRNSNYVYKQQTKIIDQNGKVIPQGTGAQAFAWYRIGVEAKPLPKSDSKRNDLAYEITYEIAPYGINDIKSEYFPKGVFRGAQKKYSYWFTGQNTSILNFEQDFNYLYYITINSRTRAQVNSRGTSDYREVEKRLYSPNSAQTNQGIDSWYTNEPAANAADYLYSPGDQATVKLSIVGDPAWIEQGEVWSGIRKKSLNTNATDPYFDAFLADGTINFDAREALFEVSFNKPADYNINTGLLDVPGSAVASQNYVYKAVTVTSNFRQGKFTQDLEGKLLVFPNTITQSQTTTTAGTTTAGTTEQQPDSTAPRDAPDESAAETARLERLASAANGLPSVPTTSVTGTTPTSSLAKGTDQILRPLTVVAEPTLSQLQASPAYITARRGGATPAAALEIARSAFASGTNNYAGVALPGINVTANTGLVKDQ
jgi:hypothetical protein